MIKLIIITWVLTYFLVKNTRGMLTCGLTAYNGPVAADPTKLKLIALFNEARGKDSCGIFNGGKTSYGCKATKDELISTVLRERVLKTDKVWRNVMIHTRKATFGAHTVENCHPFTYIKGNKRQWFMHNGTVKNWEEMCVDFGLKSKDYNVDSHALGEMVFRGHVKEMLASYKGAGAMIWCNNTDKNKMYVWKGGAGGKEERPLFYYRDSKTNGCYFSSESEPLFILSDTKNGKDLTPEVFILDLNTLYTFEDGKIIDSVVIDRSEKLHENFIIPNMSQTKTTSGGQASQKSTGASSHVGKTYGTTENSLKNTMSEKAFEKLTKGVSGFVNFLEGRFLRNGHPLQGTMSLDEIGVINGPNGVCQPYHFFDGIMIRSEGDLKVLEEFKKTNKFITRFQLESVCSFPFSTRLFGTDLSTDWWKYVKNKMSNNWIGMQDPNETLLLPFEENDTYLLFEKGILVDIEESESTEDMVKVFTEDVDILMEDLFSGIHQVLEDYNVYSAYLSEYLKEEEVENLEQKIFKILKIKEIFDADVTE
jgi:hypothetical protein